MCLKNTGTPVKKRAWHQECSDRESVCLALHDVKKNMTIAGTHEKHHHQIQHGGDNR